MIGCFTEDTTITCLFGEVPVKKGEEFSFKFDEVKTVGPTVIKYRDATFEVYSSLIEPVRGETSEDFEFLFKMVETVKTFDYMILYEDELTTFMQDCIVFPGETIGDIYNPADLNFSNRIVYRNLYSQIAEEEGIPVYNVFLSTEHFGEFLVTCKQHPNMGRIRYGIQGISGLNLLFKEIDKIDKRMKGKD